MDCRKKEKIAVYIQSLKVEGKTHRFMAVPLVPPPACWERLYVCFEPGKEMNSHGENRKMDQTSRH